MLTLQDFGIAMFLFMTYLATFKKEEYRQNFMWSLLTLGSGCYILFAGAM